LDERCTFTVAESELEKATAKENRFKYLHNRHLTFGVTIPETTWKVKCRCVEKEIKKKEKREQK